MSPYYGLPISNDAKLWLTASLIPGLFYIYGFIFYGVGLVGFDLSSLNLGGALFLAGVVTHFLGYFLLMRRRRRV